MDQMPETIQKTPSRVDFPMSWWQILQLSAQVALQHGGPFARVLVGPVGWILLGAYGCIALTYLLISYATTYFPVEVAMNPWLALVPAMAIALGMIAMLCKGFWDYLLYFVSLNQDAERVLQGQPPAFAESFQAIKQQKGTAYSLQLLLYGVITTLPLLVLFTGIGSAMGIATAGDTTLAAGIGIGSGILFLLLAFAWMFLMMFFTFIFQITAFETVPANPASVFIKSFHLTLGNYWRTFVLQILLIIATTFLLPLGISILMSWLMLTLPIDWFHQWLVDLILLGAEPPSVSDPLMATYRQIYDVISANKAMIAVELTRSLISLVVTALVLPWGTFAFTLLYKDILCRRSE